MGVCWYRYLPKVRRRTYDAWIHFNILTVAEGSSRTPAAFLNTWASERTMCALNGDQQLRDEAVEFNLEDRFLA